MRCPKCQFDHELQTTECLKCGIVFSRYQAALEKAALDAAASQAAVAVPIAAAQIPSSALLSSLPSDPDAGFTIREDDFDASRELKYRAVALPVALLVGRWMVGTGLRMPIGMLAMVLHETGHAITAWLTGRWAVPMLWVTMHGEERSWPLVLILMSAIVFGGFLAWKAKRWGWVCIAGAVLLLQLIMLSAPHPGALIVFGGDGGALVLATILMATFYAPRESAFYQNWGLRWGLLVIGAPTFMLVFRTWTGPIEDLPFGEIEGVNLSDPSLLTEMYGWSVTQLIDRYIRLATVCLVVLLALYLWGLLSAYLETRLTATQEKTADASRLPRSTSSDATAD
jgi:hypothetical protein